MTRDATADRITDIDRWQHLVFAVYFADEFPPHDPRTPLQRVLDQAAKLFPEVDGERDWEGYSMNAFVTYLRNSVREVAKV